MIDKSQLHTYYGLFTDCWRLFKEYAEYLPESKQSVGKEEQFWSSLTEKSNDVCSRYGQSRFAKDILLSVLDEIERISKKPT